MRNSIIVRSLLLIVLAPGVAGGQTLYKCVIKGKPASYQNEPCASNARVASMRAYRPEAAPTHEQILARQNREALALQESANLSRMAGTNRRGRGASAHVLPVGGSECADAKRARDAWEKQVGLRRNYNSLQIWSDRVQRACK